ncbi:MAG: hypothetical protein VX436_03030 [Planctomycetota bacterium]|nr:hypothetical protein [Planctomycetota bacterium]
MIRTGLTLLETLLALCITSVIGIAIAALMAATTDSLSSKDDGRSTAILLATAQIRLGAYIAPSLCVLDKRDNKIALWFEDRQANNTVNVSEVRWILFDNEAKLLAVKFVDFPTDWSQAMIEAADYECNLLSDYDSILSAFESSEHITTVPLVDSIETCHFWINQLNPIEATRISMRFSLMSKFGVTKDSVIDESIRLHVTPAQ